MAPPLRPGTAYHVLKHLLVGDPDPQVTTVATQWDDAAEGLLALSTAVGNAWNTRVVPGMSTSYTFIECNSIGMDAAGTVFAATVGYTSVGTDVATLLTSNTSILVKKNTGLAGRRNRGRMYVPGFQFETQVDPTGFIVPGTRAGFQTRFQNFWNDLDVRVNPSNIIILHTPTSAYTPVSSLTVEPYVATQRRRMR